MFIGFTVFAAWVWWADGAQEVSDWLGTTANTAVSGDRVRQLVGICWLIGALWHLLRLVLALL
ncbi:MAG: hypothetical protein OZSIB_4290 [Candidatus Ozemobacter sibiricus]|uniref:Uncharacterized protein n=1 Tax=Candidatus Ozemobacter sibiricus TaxID=2268124 RepID=A0A367ZNC7_9BACT|nr:MAG: hypothetical protein OZSIB_4290 [Candidatus Ozemobacter sibiricus]